MSSRPLMGPANLALLAELAASGSAREGALALLSTLATQVGASRASLAWWQAGHAVVDAQWTAPNLGEAPTLLPTQLGSALDEAIDQGLTVCWPPIRDDHDHWVSLAHRTLAQRLDGAVMSVPLPAGRTPTGAVCLEWSRGAPAITPEWQLALEATIAQTAPLLALQRQAHRPWHWHLRQASRRRWQDWSDPAKPWRRRALALALLTLAVLATWPLPDRVGGRARIEGAEQRVLVAPSDGFIKATHAHPGDRVRAGQVLADLAEQDLKLERDKWASQMAQHENSYAGAMTRADRADAAMSLAKVQEAQAQLALVDAQLQRSQLSAPFDGVVIQGDLSQSIGAPVHQGDPLLTVASTLRYRVVIDVDESDIGRLRAGQSGVMALSALPWDTLALRVQRITPLAQARDGRNVFEVQAEFTGPVPVEIRPGLMGQAKVAVGQGPWLWTTLRPLLERLRLSLWSWWG
ncbi:MAG: HlyD family efflux transporter periplasmic adaptor subunit [Rubrivivax sp.]|nr:MAG: HlyD family efflux transporter periplasmic adaptor subunit [Rubrivivax sp.]